MNSGKWNQKSLPGIAMLVIAPIAVLLVLILFYYFMTGPALHPVQKPNVNHFQFIRSITRHHAEAQLHAKAMAMGTAGGTISREAVRKHMTAVGKSLDSMEQDLKKMDSLSEIVSDTAVNAYVKDISLASIEARRYESLLSAELKKVRPDVTVVASHASSLYSALQKVSIGPLPGIQNTDTSDTSGEK